MKGLRKAGAIALRIVVGLVLFVPLLFPLYWVVVSSLQDLSTIYAKPPTLWPVVIDWDNYALAFGTILGNIGVSLAIAVAVTILAWLIGVPAAYGLARLGGRISGTFIMAMLIAQMIPGISLSIGLYSLFHSWGLLGTWWGLIIADTAQAIPFVVIVLRAFMVSLPGELFDAAAIDGAGAFTTFTRVTLPLSIPAIITVGLFSFIGAWGDFVNALTLNSGSGPQPLTLGLYKFTTLYTTDIGAIFAAATLAAIPTTILLMIGQRWIRGGIRAGALKE